MAHIVEDLGTITTTSTSPYVTHILEQLPKEDEVFTLRYTLSGHEYTNTLQYGIPNSGPNIGYDGSMEVYFRSFGTETVYSNVTIEYDYQDYHYYLFKDDKSKVRVEKILLKPTAMTAPKQEVSSITLPTSEDLREKILKKIIAPPYLMGQRPLYANIPVIFLRLKSKNESGIFGMTSLVMDVYNPLTVDCPIYIDDVIEVLLMYEE